MRRFLDARWRDLIMANYEVPTSALLDRLPTGTELDMENGRCFVSLVGFMFLDTRVMGFLIPFHINFEEVNLRFYVTRRTGDEVRRGVVFIKELVPRMAIAAVARTLYEEPYEATEMWNRRDAERVEYGWRYGGSESSMSVKRGVSKGIPADDSHPAFIIEHYWGYTKRKNGRTDEYKVEHPKWELFEPEDAEINVDFGKVYGEQFAFLNDTKPYSVLFAAGSEVSVYKGRSI
jgi:uncharacterized protein YqjF (DUF2071 family)